jgi:type IV fimbrial biogenesis protein FimT
METKASVYQQGFTLFELIISTAIIGIVSLLSLSSYSEIMSNHVPEQHLRLIKKSLNLARGQAVLLGQNITICPLINNKCVRNQWHKPLSVFFDRGNWRVLEPDDKIIIVLDAVQATHKFTYPRTAITFQPDGSIKGFTNGTFVYCTHTYNNQRQGAELTVSLTGRSRLRATKKCAL